MARTTVTPEDTDRSSGLTPTYNNATDTDGDAFLNTGREIVIAKKSDAGNITLTVQTPKTVGGLAVAEATFTVPGSDEIVVGPFSPDLYNQSDGKVYLDWSAVSNVTFAVVRIK